MGAREFELAEVKLLIDAIQSSKFITQTKSRELITKIKSFVSEHQAKQLQRQVYINDRVKTMNESVYYNVDDIHTAINQNKKIRFKYFKWDINKKLVPRHNGDWFIVSPWALTWDDENYYMVAFDDWDSKIKHYRVDKMMYISIEEEKRSGKDISFQPIDDEHSEFHVDVNVSPQFFGWIFSLGKDVKVTGPSEVVEQMKVFAREFLENMN